jgi:hypothetical protein
MNKNETTLGNILNQAEKYLWTSSLYIEAETKWDARTRAQVVETDDYTLEPLEPVATGLRRVLSMQDVQQVASNAKAQLSMPTTDQLIEALRYYVLKDAFVTFALKV